MPRKTKKNRTRKQKPIIMIGCSKKHKHNKSCSKKECPNCGPNCHCGPNCNCPHPCPGTCYLNKRGGGFGQGCGSCGCPLSPMSWSKMNQYGGKNIYPNIFDESVINNFGRIYGVGQNGGTCGACGMRGGNFYKSAEPLAGPFNGSPWGSNTNQLPGMNGIGGDRNYLASYNDKIGNDPQQQMTENSGYLNNSSTVGGGKRRKSMKRMLRGGGLFPQDMVNLGRDLTFNFKTAYNSLNGYKAPVNPTVYKDQLTGKYN